MLDILATDEHGRQLNIEMQTSLPAEMKQRLAYYCSQLYSRQLSEGANYSELAPAICICVLTQSLFPRLPQLHLDFRLRESSGTALTDDLQIHLLELAKQRASDQNIRQSSPVEQWAYFLKHADQLSVGEIAKIFADQEFLEAAKVLEMIQQTPETQQMYDARRKFQLDQESILRRARNEARDRGREEGREEGLTVARIVHCQHLLGIPQPPLDELATWDLKELHQLEQMLQGQLGARGN